MSETNYAVAPGEYLQEWIEENDLNTADTARLLGWRVSEVEEILSGAVHVDSSIAAQLQNLTNIPQRIWESYERLYRSDLARINDASGVVL